MLEYTLRCLLRSVVAKSLMYIVLDTQNSQIRRNIIMREQNLVRRHGFKQTDN